ncbi:natural resistance-associated macrophage protein [Nadsonia fulvescens var. elongata DSM 6958]|uniref:Natural resistance-associated macrophage protein n=1 Tax=Nadsonia fulvescens var. elongata DSM 6958 TaxID=857566 RepID=A0A1E3PK25_9ASCO|nr:natural resistance-associated macrophage protein [Nadsonia fulvescens var. elongata DSM 6958]
MNYATAAPDDEPKMNLVRNKNYNNSSSYDNLSNSSQDPFLLDYDKSSGLRSNGTHSQGSLKDSGLFDSTSTASGSSTQSGGIISKFSEHSYDDTKSTAYTHGDEEGLLPSSTRSSFSFSADSSLRREADNRPHNHPHNRRNDNNRKPCSSILGKMDSLRSSSSITWVKSFFGRIKQALLKYMRFVGPGIMVSVAYMDPGNYSTAVSAGAMYKYKLLFVVLISNIFAVFLQTLCVKLGSVTGLDLAQNCRKHLPPWLNLTIYVMAEIAIIATDLAEVVGTAISLNILFNMPLYVGVLITVIDVIIVLMAYRPNGPMKIVRYFEYAVSLLVTVVVVCFAVELSNIGSVDVNEIFRGFLPSKELVESQGLYLSCGILGATVMPHSLYLGSGLVQPRLKEFDVDHGYYKLTVGDDAAVSTDDYRPTLHAINYAMTYSIVELIVSLFTVALFVNCAILIVSGATLSNTPEAIDADLFSIYEMLKEILQPAAGVIFALALLFSGQSAGIVCTLSGQMVSEGFLSWSFKPWIRRLVTRCFAIAPCLFITISVGRKGLADILNASQVILSFLLPAVTAPLLYFTCSKKIMRVQVNRSHEYNRVALDEVAIQLEDYELADNSLDVDIDNDVEGVCDNELQYVDMSNSKLVSIVAVVIFTFISALNLFLLISMAMGENVHL